MLSLVAPAAARGAIVDADGGITIWVWYHNTHPGAPEGAGKLDFADVSDFTGVSGCGPTNKARNTHGAALQKSPHACGEPPLGPCLAEHKIRRDFERLAKYIYQATEGKHWLKKVYVTDKGKDGVGWPTADIRWDVGGAPPPPSGSGGSNVGGVSWTDEPLALSSDAHPLGWRFTELHVYLRSAYRACAPDIMLHELGHYLYGLPDRYPRESPDPPFRGCFPTSDGPKFVDVRINQTSEPYLEPTVMSGNYPHRFVDHENAVLYKVSHAAPSGFKGAHDELRPSVLADGDPKNDGPNHLLSSSCSDVPFAQAEWTSLNKNGPHVDLESAHPQAGDWFDEPLPPEKKVDIVIIDSKEPDPGTVLLLDNSNSMNTPAEDPVARYIQEAALYFHHSSLPPPGAPSSFPTAAGGEYVGTLLFNEEVSTLVDYGKFDPAEPLPKLDPHPTGATDIALALETAIQTLSKAHVATGANGGTIMLLSDGRSTAGKDLWEQVERAAQAGIRIHTYAFGDADTATLSAIAKYTSGDAKTVAAGEALAHEVKLDLAREATKLRGSTAIYSCKGKIKDVTPPGTRLCETGVINNGDTITSRFVVPPGTRDLLLYVFLERENAGLLTVILEDPAGNGRDEGAGQPTGVAGRFNGIRVADPIPGEWTYRIKGNLPPDDNIEIVAYARHPELQTRVWIETPEGTNEPVLKAQLVHRYPVVGLKVKPHVYDGSTRINAPADKLQLGDKEDGVYATPLFAIDGSIAHRERVRIDVELVTLAGTRPGTDVAYEPGAKYEDVERHHRDAASGGYDPDLPFKAFGTVHWTSKPATPPAPSIETYRIPRKLRNKLPGGGAVLGVLVENADLIRSQTRVSLGPGVTPRIAAFKRDGSRTTLAITYNVEASATPGPRDLKLQYGSTILEKRNAIDIAAP